MPAAIAAGPIYDTRTGLPVDDCSCCGPPPPTCRCRRPGPGNLGLYPARCVVTFSGIEHCSASPDEVDQLTIDTLNATHVIVDDRPLSAVNPGSFFHRIQVPFGVTQTVSVIIRVRIECIDPAAQSPYNYLLIDAGRGHPLNPANLSYFVFESVQPNFAVNPPTYPPAFGCLAASVPNALTCPPFPASQFRLGRNGTCTIELSDWTLVGV